MSEPVRQPKALVYHAEIVRRHWQGETMRALGSDYGTSHGYIATVIREFRERLGLDRLRPKYTITPCAICFELIASKLSQPPVFCGECTKRLIDELESLPPAEPGESGT